MPETQPLGDCPLNLPALGRASNRGKTSTELAVFDGTSVRFVHAVGQNEWHRHDFDEGFYLIDADFALQFEFGRVQLSPGDFFVVGRGLKHRGTSESGASLLRFERKHGTTSVLKE
ncbi:MAG TPA: hypothetical protein VNB28_03530 [Methylomirabilota bacterium]|nr:hypothetical protein [Methylomirabilota bacterium]